MFKIQTVFRIALSWVLLLLIFESGLSTKLQSTTQPPDTTESRQRTIYLIGDTGEPLTGEPDPVLETLKHHLERDENRHSVIFLGDNIYPHGMSPETDSPEQEEAQRRIRPALDVLRETQTDGYFISGNHDWHYGLEGILAQEQFVEQNSTADATFRFEPSNGCPGPLSVALTDNWRMILLDSEWWIAQSTDAKATNSQCEHRTRDEVIASIERIVRNHTDQHFLIATHHPLYSDGPHGGYFTAKNHLFPLTELKPWLYVPLPVIGTLYPAYRRAGNTPQDISNETYQKYVDELLLATEAAPGRIFASGHEHSLSLYEKDNHLGIVSGSGSKKSQIRKNSPALFTSGEYGFAKVHLKNNGETEVEFWTPSDNAEGENIYQKEYDAYNAEETGVAAVNLEPESPDLSEIEVQAGPGYEAGKIKEFIWGSHYRDVWTLPVNVPVIDLNSRDGGLEVVSVGGGQQSVSVVVEDSTGKRSIMRSVQKDPSEALPEILRETFANSIIQDQISASHPYGALLVPELAEAIGVHHTKPELGFLPEMEGLDLPGSDKGSLVYIEEFISANWFSSYVGKDAVDVTDSDGAWLAVRSDNNHRINEEQFLRSRLFDMFLGDWDRHDEQWFWVEIPNNEGAIFEPVPIDRDNVFFKSDGFIPWLSSRKWALRKFQHFDTDIRDIKGLNLNAQHIDRWFLNELDREDWIRIANELKENISDEDIDRSFDNWPESVQEVNREEINRKLKERIQKVDEFAERYYNVLAEEVRVFGSDSDELFRVERRQNGEVTVEMYDGSDAEPDENKLRYRRTFYPAETQEIHIYGFDGEDRFDITGEADDSIVIRLIPGEETDIVNDNIHQGDGRKSLWIYDTYNGATMNISRSTRLQLTDNQEVHRYDRESFQYNYAGPLLTGGFNPDDGIFLGAGTRIIRHGFRKEPYASFHEFRAKHALQSSAFSFDLKNRFTEQVGTLDLKLDITVLAPNFKANYFGLGNNTEQLNDSNSFYRFRMDQVEVQTMLIKRLSDITEIEFGPQYKYFSPSQTPNRFVSSEESGLEEENFKGHHFGVLSGAILINGTDNDVIPFYGFQLDTGVAANFGFNERSDTFVRFHGEGSLYYTFERYRSTLATRIGGAVNAGSFDFFRANTLGGNVLLGDQGKLRGFLRDRFAGRTSFYHNLEIRNRLIDFQTYLFPASLGILAFMDQGRVWLDDEDSDKWHRGYGGGIYITPFRRAVISATIGISDEDEIFTINAGFSF